MNEAPLALVNPLCGSDSELSFSTGLTYPAVGVPWGMTYWSPRNRPGGHVFSRRRTWPVNQLHGFTATHAPSPWMGDYGSLTLFPHVGPVPEVGGQRFNSYRLDTEQSRPDQYTCRLTSPEIDCHLTATARCGVLKLAYPKSRQASLGIQLSCARCAVRVDGDVVLATARDGMMPEGYACHYVIQLDRPITRTRPIPGDGDAGDFLVLEFDTSDGQPVTARVGTSFISHDQARRNLSREVGERPFEAVQQAAAQAWSTELNRVQITGGTRDQRRTFYTGLYRALLFPRTLTEFDDNDAAVHMSPYTGQVERGTLITDNGFWDTSRSVYSLLSLVWRKRFGELCDAWLRCFTQSGWMPQWASPGHRSCMVGTHSAAVFAEATVKGIEGFDRQVALDSVLKDATVPGDPEGRYGRQQLPHYLELGFCPDDPATGDIDSVCRTLDYSYNDWSCAQIADVVGDAETAATMRKRAGNWRHLWDPETRFFRPKQADGQWATPFREFAWGGPYREGGPWQYRFSVPHDPAGLAECFGGADALAKELERMVALPPSFEIGTYGRQIHEMAEMAGGTMGQYGHNNQPCHGALWTAARVGRGDVTDRLVRRVLTELYTPDAFPGDEDNGEMGAWYALASLGLFPHCPGSSSYTTTEPLWDSFELHGDDGRVIRMTRDDVTKQRSIEHADLINSAT